MSRHRRRKAEFSAMADINIANLVDVVLVLLIIFMISAPLLQSGIEVNLPETKAAAVTEQEEGIVITIAKQNDIAGIFINDKWTLPKDFKDHLQREIDLKGTRTIYLRGDTAVSYGFAVDVISQLKEYGITDIGLVTAHVEKKSK